MVRGDAHVMPKACRSHPARHKSSAGRGPQQSWLRRDLHTASIPPPVVESDQPDDAHSAHSRPSIRQTFAVRPRKLKSRGHRRHYIEGGATDSTTPEPRVEELLQRYALGSAATKQTAVGKSTGWARRGRGAPRVWAVETEHRDTNSCGVATVFVQLGYYKENVVVVAGGSEAAGSTLRKGSPSW